MRRLTLVVIVLVALLSARPATASLSAVYLASTAQGGNTGADCADAFVYTFFNTAGNWGAGSTQIGAGTVVHLCGTITMGAANTTALTFQGSGSSGNVITLHFESGATLSSPAWPTAGAIALNGKNFLLIDGGGTGTITATANGSGLANQLNSSGIVISGSHDIEITGLSITSLYQHTSTSDTTPDVTACGCVYANGFGNNILIHDDTFTDVPWCPNLQYSGTESNLQIYNNNIGRAAHGPTPSASAGSGALSNVTIHDNHIHDFGNWATAADAYHLTGLHIYGNSGTSTLTTVSIYNNLFDGTWGDPSCPGNTGGCITAFVFIEGGGSKSSATGLSFYNNVGVSDAPINNGLFGIYDGTNDLVYNNTMVGSSTSAGLCFGSNTSLTGFVFQNNVMTTCNQLIQFTGTFASGSPDYNIYGNGGSNAFHCGSNFYTFGQFASWKTCAGGAQDAHSSAPASAGLSASGVPQTGSAVITAGTNLTSLGISALNSDTTAGNTRTAVARPSSSPWDVGAYQFAAPPGTRPLRNLVIRSGDVAVLMALPLFGLRRKLKRTENRP